MLDVAHPQPGVSAHRRPNQFLSGLAVGTAYAVTTDNHEGTIAVESEPGLWTQPVIRPPLAPT